MALVEMCQDPNFGEMLGVLKRQKTAITLAHLPEDHPHAVSTRLSHAFWILGSDSEQTARDDYAYFLKRMETFGMHDYRGLLANQACIHIADIVDDWEDVEHLTRKRLSTVHEGDGHEETAQMLLLLAHALVKMGRSDEALIELSNCADVLRLASPRDRANIFHEALTSSHASWLGRLDPLTDSNIPYLQTGIELALCIAEREEGPAT
jgi:hypothetical protein